LHIPDGYLGPQTYGAAYAAMLPAWALAARRASVALKGQHAPLLGLAAAFCFMVQMLNLPIPGGTTGHATGAALVAILLGPAQALVAMTVALAVQAVVFGDGGITAFGANCFNMAFVMPFAASGVFRLLAGNSVVGARRRFLAAAAAGYISLNLAAFTTAVMFGLQPLVAHDAAGRPLYCPYGLEIALPAMMIPHLLVFGFAEAAVALALAYLEGIPLAWRPSFRPAIGEARALSVDRRAQARRSLPMARKWGVVVALLMLISPLGLLLPAWLGAETAWGEWSAQEIEHLVGYLPQGMVAWAEKWESPLPDYAFPHQTDGGQAWQGEAAGWLTLAYIASALVGVGLVVGIGWSLARWLGGGKGRPEAG